MHVVGPNQQDIIAEAVAVKQAERVLHVGIVADVKARQLLIIRFIVFVKGVRGLQFVVIVHRPLPAQSAAGVAIAFRCVNRAGKLTEEIACASGQFQPVGEPVRQLILEVPCGVAVDCREHARHGVGATCHIIVVNARAIHVEKVRKPLPSLLPRQAVTLVVMLAPARVCVQGKGARGLFRDNIDDASAGIRPVKRRGSTSDNFDMVDIIHRQAREINIIHRLACEPFAIDKHQHALAPEA